GGEPVSPVAPAAPTRGGALAGAGAGPRDRAGGADADAAAFAQPHSPAARGGGAARAPDPAAVVHPAVPERLRAGPARSRRAAGDRAPDGSYRRAGAAGRSGGVCRPAPRQVLEQRKVGLNVRAPGERARQEPAAARLAEPPRPVGPGGP